MRLLFAASLFSLALGAPSHHQSSLAEWGTALSKSISWIEGVSPSDQFAIDDYLSDDKTVYQIVKDDKEFSILAKLIDRDRSLVDYLDDKKNRMTLFAPNNEAFEAVRHHHPMGGHDEDDERRRPSKEMVRAFVMYHILPEVMEYDCLGRNSTLATELRAEDGTIGGRRRRIKVHSNMLTPRTVKINNYAAITQADIRARNGVIQKLDRPLFLPPDVMDVLYLLPDEFSITAVALLKSNLEEELEFNSRWSKDNKHRGPNNGNLDHHPHDGRRRGSAAVTFFVPTNEAWAKLPEDLKFYLFSPAGERTLRKIMEYHTIPDEVLFTEYRVHVDDKKHRDRDRDDDDKNRRRHRDRDDDDRDEEEECKRDLSFRYQKKFRTLIDQDMPVEVIKSKTKGPRSELYNFDFRAHGIEIQWRDNVAQNGAVHTIGSVICPRERGPRDEKQNQEDWKEWRKWLVEWSRKTEDDGGRDRDRECTCDRY